MDNKYFDSLEIDINNYIYSSNFNTNLDYYFNLICETYSINLYNDIDFKRYEDLLYSFINNDTKEYEKEKVLIELRRLLKIKQNQRFIDLFNYIKFNKISENDLIKIKEYIVVFQLKNNVFPTFYSSLFNIYNKRNDLLLNKDNKNIKYGEILKKDKRYE